MSRKKRLSTNPILLFWAKAFAELKTLNAIVVLFYLHRGVTIEEIFILSVVWSVAALIFEVPSGYLADIVGRKRTLMLGSFFLLLASVGAFFANGFEQFIVVFVLMSLFYSMFSGSDEALLYDSLKELGKESTMTKQYGRYTSAHHILKIFLPAIGALIAKGLLEWQFQVVIGIDIIGAILSILFLSMLIEPKRTKSVAEYEVGIYRESLETIKKDTIFCCVQQ